MDSSVHRPPVAQISTTTASPWPFAFGFWFTYLPPASLVGREVRMR